MEMIAVALGVVGGSAVLAWGDSAKRKVGAGLSLVVVSTRVASVDARVAELEKQGLDTRNKVAGLTSLANSARRR